MPLPFSPLTALKLATLSGCLTLGACGQRGDLYLPSSSATPERATLGDTLVAPLTTAAPVVPAVPAATATTADRDFVKP